MNSPATILKVFVYGTLKPGEANYKIYCQGKTIAETPAYIRGELYQLSRGYPAVCQGNRKITGYLLEFIVPREQSPEDCHVLRQLDQLEDYQKNRPTKFNEYYRLQVKTFDPNDNFLDYAWCYFMTQDQILSLKGKVILDNKWQSFRSK